MIADSIHLADLFTRLVGPEHIRSATSDDRIDDVQPALVVSPGSTEEVADILRIATEQGLAVIPRGGGTKQGWGNPPRRADIVLSTHRLNRLLEHAYGDMTATVEAGTSLAALQAALAQHGQMLALDPAWPERATLGGIVAADASGPLRIRYGTARDLVIGIGVVLADGTIAFGGGKVVKNVAGYDLMKLFTGAHGTLGMITTLTVRLHPVPAATRSLSITLPYARAAQDLIVRLNHSTITPLGLQVMSAHDGYVAAIRLAGVPSSVDAQASMLELLAAEQNLPVDVLDERAAAEVWTVHETIYDHPDAVIARWSVLPTSLAAALETMANIGSRLGLDVHLVVQGTGTGLVRFHGANEQALLAAIGATRARLAEHRGYLVVQHCAPSLKERLDVWGTPGDTLSLMQRVKTHFDPQGTLNPGRYVGRI